MQEERSATEIEYDVIIIFDQDERKLNRSSMIKEKLKARTENLLASKKSEQIYYRIG